MAAEKNNQELNQDQINAAYCEENAVIAVPGWHSSSTFMFQIDSLIRGDDEICINITTFRPPGSAVTDDILFRYFLISVSKADILGVMQFSYNQTFRVFPWLV